VPLLFPQVSVLPLSRYGAILGPTRMEESARRIGEIRARLTGRVVWNISSSAVGGGVAEMVRTLLAYARGAGVDARWVVIQGPSEFFRITKRLHNAIHGSSGDGSPLGPDERRIYDQVSQRNAAELIPMVRRRDIAIVHDPQPAGMIAALRAAGAHVIWRCHIGHDQINADVERGWGFLAPYLADAAAYVFSRAAYIPRELDAGRAVVIPPSLDPFSAKNQVLPERAIAAILVETGLVAGVPDEEAALFIREDGTPGRVDRTAVVVRDGPLPGLDTPLVVQVSRWDRLKDPIGVLHGFARIPPAAAHGAHLILAGPDSTSVRDDPEGAAVYGDVVEAWGALEPSVRVRVHLASLPTVDIDENAAMVNALQRHAAVVVQKSLFEGFGMTVTEAMWKGRPVVASAVGGIQDQIEDGVQGLLLRDPRDPSELAAAVARVLDDPVLARQLGEHAHARVVDRYLGLDSLLKYGALIERLER